MFAVAAVCGLILASHAPAPPLTADTAAIRKELEAWYEQNASAYQRWDFDAIMALRSPDFAPSGRMAPPGTAPRWSSTSRGS